MGKKLILVCSLFVSVQLEGMFVIPRERSLRTLLALSKYFGKRPSNEPRKSCVEKECLDGQLEGFKALAGKLPSAVNEFMNFLRNSSRYRTIGYSIPKGMLLVGPSGVGKAAIARAIAHDSNRMFLPLNSALCNSKHPRDGVQAVTEIFEEAKLYAVSNKQSIIFIDEIDCIGAHHSTCERDVSRDSTATLNKLLSLMDSFEVNNEIFVIGATNRKEVLDKALLERFGYIVDVPLPDEDDRREICMYYLKKMKYTLNEAYIEKLVEHTSGYSADYIKNIINLSGIKAVRDNENTIEFKHVMVALQEILKQPNH